MRAWSSPSLHREADPAQDLVAVDGDVEVVDLEQWVASHGRPFY